MKNIRKFKYLIVILIVVSGSLSAFSNTIDPFGTFDNTALVRSDGTGLIKLAPIVDVEFAQNFLILDNLNALLNEEEITINATTMENAIRNGMHLSMPIEIGAYGNLNLFGFNVVPYLIADGKLSVNLPKTFSEILFSDTKLEDTIEGSVTDFVRSNIKMNLGIGLVYNNFFIDTNFFVPLIYSVQDKMYAHTSYTSSSSPTNVNVEFDSRIILVGNTNFGDIGEKLSDPIAISNETLDAILQGIAGFKISLGYGNDNWGLAVNDITIKSAQAKYGMEVSANGSVNYSAENTVITTDATYTLSEPEFYQLLEPLQINTPIKLTGYYKSDDFFMWGLAGMYSFDGDWATDAYVGINLQMFKMYYMMEFAPNVYANTLGFGFNFGLINSELQLTMTSDSFSPLGSSTPGFGVHLKVGAGF